MARKIGGEVVEADRVAVDADSSPTAEEPMPNGIRVSPFRGRVVDGWIVLALLTAGFLLSRRPLAPSSLWLDDAWVAIGYRAKSLDEAYAVTMTAPGFSLFVTAWLKLFGFSELRAQWWPFVFGLAGPPVVYLVVARRTLQRSVAFLAAGLVLAAPVHLVYSTRVKHYTLDLVLSAVLIGLAWALLDDVTSRRRWVSFVGVSIIAVAISAGVTPIVAASFVATIALVLVRHRDRFTLTSLMSALTVFGAFALVWNAFVIQPASVPGLVTYWRNAGGFLSDAPASTVFGKVVRGFSSFPPQLVWAVLIAAAATVLVRRFFLGLLLVAPFVVAVVLSTMTQAPLGGRVDQYLYPPFAVLVALAVEPLLHRSRDTMVVGFVLVVVLLANVRAPVTYPDEDIRPFVATIDQRARSHDRILLYQGGLWGYALYTKGPITLVSTDAGVGFNVVLGDPRIDLTRGTPSHLARLSSELHDQRPARIWYVGTHGRPEATHVPQALADAGYRTLLEQGTLQSAWLQLWVLE